MILYIIFNLKLAFSPSLLGIAAIFAAARGTPING